MSQVSHVLLTCLEARGLKCPFTGKELQIYAHICDGVVTYSAPKAFTLREPRKDVALLYRYASMRNGIMGSVTMEQSLIDPYTKEEFVLAEGADGTVWFEGGFDPRCACMSLAEFISKASCGTRVIDEPPPATSVEHPGDMTPNDDGEVHNAVDEITEQAAHEIVNAIPGANKGRTVVGFVGEPKPHGTPIGKGGSRR